jgi:hypothetical protein
VTAKLPFTALGVERAIRGAKKAGYFVVGVRPADGTVIVAEKPFDAASLIPVDRPSSPSARRFGEKLDGGQGEA